METIIDSPALRFTVLIESLCKALGEHGGRRRIAGPLLLIIYRVLKRMLRQFVAIEARLRAGTLVARPARARRASPRPAESPQPIIRKPPSMLPRQQGWLVKLIPETCTCAGQLSHLLQHPQMAAMFAEAPQLGRILRPLSRILGVRLRVLGTELLPGLSPLPRPRVRKPKASKPKPEQPRPSNRDWRPQWRGPNRLWRSKAEYLRAYPPKRE